MVSRYTISHAFSFRHLREDLRCRLLTNCGHKDIAHFSRTLGLSVQDTIRSLEGILTLIPAPRVKEFHYQLFSLNPLKLVIRRCRKRLSRVLNRSITDGAWLVGCRRKRHPSLASRRLAWSTLVWTSRRLSGGSRRKDPKESLIGH